MKIKNDFIRNFIIGFGSILNIYPEKKTYEIHESDLDALESDWKTVGEDFKTVMSDFNKIITNEKRT